MNFYKHHLGDYAQATSHLTFVEDAAYSRLIRKYYADERPLPGDVAACQRLVGARTREEKRAVADVLREFFQFENGVHHSKRCDEEIARAQSQAAANRLIAEQREATKRARTQHESCNGSFNESLNQSCNGSLLSREPIQTPDSTSHKPLASKTKNPTAAAQPAWVEEFKAVYPRRAGSQPWPRAIAAAKARIGEGHTPAEFIDGARRYAEFVRASGKERTEFVQQAATFLGPAKPFLELWDAPATKAEIRLVSNLTAAEEFMRRTEPSNAA